MTAVKEQFMEMLPTSLPEVPDDEVQNMINILVKWNKLKKSTSGKRILGISDGKYKYPDNINAFDDEIEKMLTDVDYDTEPKKSVKRTFGALKNDDFYMAPDFDSCFSDDPAAFGLEEYM